jgi:hypothetical protein
MFSFHLVGHESDIGERYVLKGNMVLYYINEDVESTYFSAD